VVGAAHFLAEKSTYLLFVPRTYCNTITTPSCAHEEEQILCLSARFMLITPKDKNRAFNAYQQANAVLCLSASECCFMLISAFHAYQLEDMAFNAYQGVENN
jgi:hypothetical protein